MLKQIYFENFKSFEKGRIDLKPITILLRANNVGKSSIIQLLLMVEQTANYNKKYNSALRLNGEYVKLGEAENIFKDMKIDKEITIEFIINSTDFQSAVVNISKSVYDVIVEKYSLLNRIRQLLQHAPIRDNWPEISKRIIDRNDSDEILTFISNAKELQKKVKAEIKTNKDSVLEIENYFLKSAIEKVTYTDLLNYNFNEAKDIIHLLQNLRKNLPEELIISYGIKHTNNDNLLEVSRISIRSDKQVFIESYFKSKYVFFSDLIDKKRSEKYRINIGKVLNFLTIFDLKQKSDGLNPNYFSARYHLRNSKNIFIDVIYFLVQSSIDLLRECFDEQFINYVNPLRAFPKRYYFLDKANVGHSLNTIDGDNLTEILKDNPMVKAKVNKWLSKFEIEVEVQSLQDVIHQINIHQHGLNLDITDVGFGISQVLPVIVQGFLSHQNSLTIIEQPEIHLHPKMQAELADLFIDVIYSTSKQATKKLLIETHSEYLLKRLRRRIAEGKLKADDVGIYFIHPRIKNKTSALIEEIEVSEKGAFEWPREFYADDLMDTIEFLKLQQ